MLKKNFIFYVFLNMKLEDIRLIVFIFLKMSMVRILLNYILYLLVYLYREKCRQTTTKEKKKTKIINTINANTLHRQLLHFTRGTGSSVVSDLSVRREIIKSTCAFEIKIKITHKDR